MTITGSHFDYENQAWTVDGRYQTCGHPESNCGCYGKLHAGESASIYNLPTAAVVYDPACEFVRRFYRENERVSLNSPATRIQFWKGGGQV